MHFPSAERIQQRLAAMALAETTEALNMDDMTREVLHEMKAEQYILQCRIATKKSTTTTTTTTGGEPLDSSDSAGSAQLPCKSKNSVDDSSEETLEELQQKLASVTLKIEKLEKRVAEQQQQPVVTCQATAESNGAES